MKTAQGCVILRRLLPEAGDGAVSEQVIKDFVDQEIRQHEDDLATIQLSADTSDYYVHLASNRCREAFDC